MFNHANIGFNRKAKWNRIVFRTVHPSQLVSAHVRTKMELPICMCTRLDIPVFFRTRLEIVKEIMRTGG